MVEESMEVATAQACSTESNIALIILDFDAISAKHGFAAEPESTEPRPNEPTPVGLGKVIHWIITKSKSTYR